MIYELTKTYFGGDKKVPTLKISLIVLSIVFLLEFVSLPYTYTILTTYLPKTHSQQSEERELFSKLVFSNMNDEQVLEAKSEAVRLDSLNSPLGSLVLAELYMKHPKLTGGTEAMARSVLEKAIAQEHTMNTGMVMDRLLLMYRETAGMVTTQKVESLAGRSFELYSSIGRVRRACEEISILTISRHFLCDKHDD